MLTATRRQIVLDPRGRDSAGRTEGGRPRCRYHEGWNGTARDQRALSFPTRAAPRRPESIPRRRENSEAVSADLQQYATSLIGHFPRTGPDKARIVWAWLTNVNTPPICH